MKLSKELLNQVTLHTDTIYEEELDVEHAEDLIKDLLLAIKKLNDEAERLNENINELNEEIDYINSGKQKYQSSYDIAFECL